MLMSMLRLFLMWE